MGEGYLAELLGAGQLRVNPSQLSPRAARGAAEPEVGELGRRRVAVPAAAREAPFQVVPPSPFGHALGGLLVLVRVAEGVFVFGLRVLVGGVGGPLPDAADHVEEAVRALAARPDADGQGGARA